MKRSAAAAGRKLVHKRMQEFHEEHQQSWLACGRSAGEREQQHELQGRHGLTRGCTHNAAEGRKWASQGGCGEWQGLHKRRMASARRMRGPWPWSTALLTTARSFGQGFFKARRTASGALAVGATRCPHTSRDTECSGRMALAGGQVHLRAAGTDGRTVQAGNKRHGRAAMAAGAVQTTMRSDVFSVIGPAAACWAGTLPCWPSGLQPHSDDVNPYECRRTPVRNQWGQVLQYSLRCLSPGLGRGAGARCRSLPLDPLLTRGFEPLPLSLLLWAQCQRRPYAALILRQAWQAWQGVAIDRQQGGHSVVPCHCGTMRIAVYRQQQRSAVSQSWSVLSPLHTLSTVRQECSRPCLVLYFHVLAAGPARGVGRASRLPLLWRVPLLAPHGQPRAVAALVEAAEEGVGLRGLPPAAWLVHPACGRARGQAAPVRWASE